MRWDEYFRKRSNRRNFLLICRMDDKAAQAGFHLPLDFAPMGQVLAAVQHFDNNFHIIRQNKFMVARRIGDGCFIGTADLGMYMPLFITINKKILCILMFSPWSVSFRVVAKLGINIQTILLFG